MKDEETMRHVYNMQRHQLEDMDVVWHGITTTRNMELRRNALKAYRNMIADLEDFEVIARIPHYKRIDLKRRKLELRMWEYYVDYRPIDGCRPISVVGSDVMFASKADAAKVFGVNRKAIQNHMDKKTRINGFLLEYGND